MNQPAVPKPELPRDPKAGSILTRLGQLIPVPIKATIAQSDLPASVKDVAWKFIDSAKWQGTKGRALTQVMLRYFSEQLQNGVSPDALVAEWGAALPLPAFRKWGEPELLAIHSLPEPVRELLVRTVRQTRLWRGEQVDIARELMVHFQDGMEAGQTPEDLIQSFGDTATAARLIRRAKLRNRSVVWKILRRIPLAIGILFAVFVGWWIWLLIRFQFAKPHITYDYIGQVDARSKAIPESDRAWPLYAAALTKLNWSPRSNTKIAIPPLDSEGKPVPEWQELTRSVDVQRIDGRITREWPVTPEGLGAPSSMQNVEREYRVDHQEFLKAFEELSAGKHWPALVQYAQQNAESIELAMRGSAKPEFGFVFRDPVNADWLAGTNAGNYEACLKSSQSLLMGVLIPQMQHIQSIPILLQIECERARVAGEHERVVEVLTAELRLAAQIHHADGFAVSRLIGIIVAHGPWNTIRRTLAEQPDFFTDGDLQTLLQRIADYRATVDLEIRPNTRAMFNDILQRFYSDDGHGDGCLTADGYAFLRSDGQPHFPQPASTQLHLEGSLLSGVVASRAELKRFMDHFCDLEDAEARTPLWESQLDGPSPAIRYAQSILDSWPNRIKFRPMALLEPMWKLGDSGVRGGHLYSDGAKMTCDATQLALNLELYRRLHGSWPTDLQQLCPEFLSAVPIDRFDGKPFKYLLEDGKPVVYSVGRNKVDDGGKVSMSAKQGVECKDGDWRLWPLWNGDK